jgi:hypothetical protein
MSKLIFLLFICRSIIPDRLETNSSSVVEKMKSFNEPETWPYRPMYVSASPNTRVKNVDLDEPLPLGVPLEVETSIFEGKILLRFQSTQPDRSKPDPAFLDKSKRFLQVVVQGRFKKPLSFADVYVGGIFQRPLQYAPPPVFARLLHVLFSKIAPGTIMDLGSSQPRVLVLGAGVAERLSINQPGQEPDITAIDIPENTETVFGDKYKSSSERKRHFSKRQKASTHFYDTEKIYTFQYYDEVMDYGNFNIELPLYGRFDLSRVIGNQPWPFSVVTTDGEVVLSIDCWHENLVKQSDGFP